MRIFRKLRDSKNPDCEKCKKCNGIGKFQVSGSGTMGMDFYDASYDPCPRCQGRKFLWKRKKCFFETSRGTVNIEIDETKFLDVYPSDLSFDRLGYFSDYYKFDAGLYPQKITEDGIYISNSPNYYRLEYLYPNGYLGEILQTIEGDTWILVYLKDDNDQIMMIGNPEYRLIRL